MNWDAIGATGEIIGAVAVVASLVYLATQIQISNKNARNSAHQELMDQYLRIYHQIVDTPEASTLWVRGNQDDPTLTPDELIRFRAILTPSVLTWQRFFYLNKQGDIDDYMYEGMNFVRKQIVRSPGFQRWYKERREQLGIEFRELIDKEVGVAGPDYSPLGVIPEQSPHDEDANKT